jgi:16S rRNA (adenine1518-N6/adenine1519-N6)-dimethyltransferase
VEEGDLVLEVGPGPGSLTQALLEKGARVVAVEKDEALASALMRLQTPDGRLQVFCHDIMTFDLQQHLPVTEKKVKLIANLPYHLTTPILAQMALQNTLFSSLTVMVQDEVGRRMTAQPGNSDYSSFTVFLNFYTSPQYAFKVSRNCFYPVPKVDSAIIVLPLHPPPADIDSVLFFKMTRQAFEHRRKMLKASLKEMYPPEKICACLELIGQNPLARPEVLSLEEFIQLFEQLNRPK